jgi:hypothetical protein
VAVAMFEGVKRYATFCEHTGKLGTEFVKRAATFFGPAQHYHEDWLIPKANGRSAQADAAAEKFERGERRGE